MKIDKNELKATLLTVIDEADLSQKWKGILIRDIDADRIPQMTEYVNDSLRRSETDRPTSTRKLAESYHLTANLYYIKGCDDIASVYQIVSDLLGFSLNVAIKGHSTQTLDRDGSVLVNTLEHYRYSKPAISGVCIVLNHARNAKTTLAVYKAVSEIIKTVHVKLV